MVTRERGRSFLVGVGLLCAVALAGYVALTAKAGTPLSRHTRVKAAFSDVGQLSAGDDVRRDSVRIGQVGAIDYSGSQAVVTMELSAHETVHADARAAMWDQSALGQKFVELDPGSAAAGPGRGSGRGADRLRRVADFDGRERAVRRRGGSRCRRRDACPHRWRAPRPLAPPVAQARF